MHFCQDEFFALLALLPFAGRGVAWLKSKLHNHKNCHEGCKWERSNLRFKLLSMSVVRASVPWYLKWKEPKRSPYYKLPSGRF